MTSSEKKSKPRAIAVVGKSGYIEESVYNQAMELGKLAVDAGYYIVCGGRDGVMEAVCRGAHLSENWFFGATVGILPSYHRSEANPWVDVVIPTGLGLARNAVVAASGEVVISINGGPGTLSEMAYAWQFGKPLISLSQTGGWSQFLAQIKPPDTLNFPPNFYRASTPKEAIELTQKLCPI